jgi:hypothetical protein
MTNKIKKIIKKYLKPNLNIPLIQKMRETSFIIKEKLTGYSNEKKRFKKKTGYCLDLNNPQSFNQKIVWKKLNDRNPLLPTAVDKYKVRQYLKEVLGKEAEKILIPLLYVTSDPDSIPFDELPAEYIIKANHASGWNIIVDKNTPANKKEIINKCKDYLNKPYGLFKHEWAYQKVKRRIVIEKLIRDENGQLPMDYKFSVIHGKCLFIQVDFERFIDHKRSLFTPQWDFLNVRWKKKQGIFIKKPVKLKTMIELAEFLGFISDYVRIDLYLVCNKIYFGEMTFYPASGNGAFVPRNFDFELGKHWKLKKNYWEEI